MRDNININYRDSRLLLEVIDYYLTASDNTVIVDSVSLPRLRALKQRLLDVAPPNRTR